MMYDAPVGFNGFLKSFTYVACIFVAGIGVWFLMKVGFDVEVYP